MYRNTTESKYIFGHWVQLNRKQFGKFKEKTACVSLVCLCLLASPWSLEEQSDPGRHTQRCPPWHRRRPHSPERDEDNTRAPEVRGGSITGSRSTNQSTWRRSVPVAENPSSICHTVNFLTSSLGRVVPPVSVYHSLSRFFSFFVSLYSLQTHTGTKQTDFSRRPYSCQCPGKRSSLCLRHLTQPILCVRRHVQPPSFRTTRTDVSIRWITKTGFEYFLF